MRALELFAGAGGLGMGTARAGFKHVAVVEWNRQACDTIRDNQAHGVKPVSDWPLHVNLVSDLNLFNLLRR